MNEMQMINVVERFSRKLAQEEGQIKVTQLPDYKTVYIEQIGEEGRSVILKEYKVDGNSYWAGYSMRSDTIFLSQGSRNSR